MNAKNKVIRVRHVMKTGVDVIDGMLAGLSLVSVPTLYNLFGGKSELLSASIESDFVMLIRHANADQQRHGLERVLGLVAMLSHQLRVNPTYSRSLMGFFFGSASESTSLREFVARELTQGLVQGLDEMQGSRQLVPWVETHALGERAVGGILLFGSQDAKWHFG